LELLFAEGLAAGAAVHDNPSEPKQVGPEATPIGLAGVATQRRAAEVDGVEAVAADDQILAAEVAVGDARAVDGIEQHSQLDREALQRSIGMMSDHFRIMPYL
jgi:hypothetical protein